MKNALIDINTQSRDAARLQALLGNFVDALHGALTAVDGLTKLQAEPPSMPALSGGSGLFDRA